MITSDILELMRAVSTSLEWKSFMKLEVVSAVYYSKEDEVQDLENWVKQVIETPGSLDFADSTQGRHDSRPRHWYGLPLSAFIGKLVAYRNQLKAEMKREKYPEKRGYLDAQQNAIKKVINTFYGIEASPYFPVGNVVLADTITARCRCEAWKMAKALNLTQVITDGGMYSPQEVFYLREGVRDPGFHTFADIRERLPRHKSIQRGCLHTIDWKAVFSSPESESESVFSQVDQFAMEHLNLFWQRYGLSMKLNFCWCSGILIRISCGI